MVKEIYGKKIGMTQIFGENEVAIPVTAIEAMPLTVVAKKTQDKDGYNAIVVSFGDIKEKNANKPHKGIFEKAGVEVQKYLKEIKVENVDEYEVGSKITVEAFEQNDKVDVQGTSKGKGFQGVIKRHGQHRGPMGHGSMYHRRPGSMGSTTTPGRVFKGFQGVIKRHGQHRGPMGHGSMYHRRPGSMGSTTTPGRVFKGKKLPGHMGSQTSTILNLDVVKVDTDKNVILVKGSIPGAKKSIVRVRKSVK